MICLFYVVAWITQYKHGSVRKKVKALDVSFYWLVSVKSVCLKTILCFWQVQKQRAGCAELCGESVHPGELKENQEAAETLTMWYQLWVTHVLNTRLDQIGKISWNWPAVWPVTRCGCVWVRYVWFGSLHPCVVGDASVWKVGQKLKIYRKPLF